MRNPQNPSGPAVRAVRIAILAHLLLFLGRSGAQALRRALRPELFRVASAPWYTGILLDGMFSLLAMALLLLLLWVLKRRETRQSR